MTLEEPTNFDMLENFIHEVGHSLAVDMGWQIYDDRLTSEFLSKGKRLAFRCFKAEGLSYKLIPFSMIPLNIIRNLMNF